MSDRQAPLRWRWGVGALIFLAGNLVGWATDGDPLGTAVALACMLVLSWAVPVWIARRARPQRPAAPWPDAKVRWRDGAWRTRGRDYYWEFEPRGRVWRRGSEILPGAAAAASPAAVWEARRRIDIDLVDAELLLRYCEPGSTLEAPVITAENYRRFVVAQAEGERLRRLGGDSAGGARDRASRPSGLAGVRAARH